jgi:hypothetical protein
MSEGRGIDHEMAIFRAPAELRHWESGVWSWFLYNHGDASGFCGDSESSDLIPSAVRAIQWLGRLEPQERATELRSGHQTARHD